jgi:hypothetical protein
MNVTLTGSTGFIGSHVLMNFRRMATKWRRSSQGSGLRIARIRSDNQSRHASDSPAPASVSVAASAGSVPPAQPGTQPPACSCQIFQNTSTGAEMFEVTTGDSASLVRYGRSKDHLTVI